MSKQIVTPPAILSYPHLFKPQAPMEEGGNAMYGAVLVFAKDTDLRELKAAALEAATEKYGDKAAGMIRSGKLKWPFRTDEDKGYPEGSCFISPRSKDRPLVVARYKSPVDGKAEEITDEAVVYAGAIVKGLVKAYCYDRSGNKGVTFGLNGIQKWADGDRLDGRVSARDAFDAEEPVAADLSDMTGEEDDEETPAPEPAKKGKGKKAPKEDDLSDLLG